MTSTPDTATFVAGLPKVELHVHLVGAASVQTVLELARRHPDAGVPTDEGQLRAFYRFSDFSHFIEVYIAVNSLVRTADDIEDLVVGVAADLAGQAVRYAELTVTPDSQLLMGVPPDGVAHALTAARSRAAAECGVRLGWVFDIPGELGLPSGERTIEWVERFAPDGTVGFGLGGPEAGVARPQFGHVFARARALGLASVPHAGETTGPQAIWDALQHLGAQRIGHGIRAVDDAELVQHLVRHRIPLEVCPTSNLRTRAVATMGEHPLRQLVDAGVRVTLGSDDPGMFDTTLNAEYRVACHALGLSTDGLADLARTGVDVSFADEALKQQLRREIDDYVASASPQTR